jgi:hypothetical protein
VAAETELGVDDQIRYRWSFQLMVALVFSRSERTRLQNGQLAAPRLSHRRTPGAAPDADLTPPAP